MRFKSLTRLFAGVAFAAALSVSCSEISFIEINPPADLQEKIDAIQAEKDAANALLGDKKPIDIEVPIVGAEDFTSGYFGAKSQAFVVPTGKMLILEFVNHTPKTNNWNNWNLVITNPIAADGTGYKEYLILRADNWANIKDDSIVMNIECPDRNEDGDIWDDFREIMDGAAVTMKVDHSKTGTMFIEATAVGTDGSIVKNYCTQNMTTTEDVWAYIVTDGSWFEMKAAFVAPSEVAEVPDEMAASIAVTGTPASIEIGSTDFWGNGVATVTFADGSTAVADTADVTFVVPDLSTVGTKTIIYSYSKTKQGNYGKAVAGTYTLEVVNPVVSMAVTKQPALTTYYVYEAAPATLAFSTAGMEVTATYADGATGVVNNSSLICGEVPVTPGEQEVEIKYVGVSATITTTCKINVVKGVAEVGLADCTTPWWTAFAADKVVASGESVTFKMMVYSSGKENYHSPCTILRQADLVENAVVRMDNFGWGAGYDGNDTKVLESNWNWDVFKSSINLSNVTITVTNNGDNTADIRYVVIYPDGEEHFQNYLGIKVNSADLQAALVTEGSYLVLYE